MGGRGVGPEKFRYWGRGRLPISGHWTISDTGVLSRSQFLQVVFKSNRAIVDMYLSKLLDVFIKHVSVRDGWRLQNG